MNNLTVKTSVIHIRKGKNNVKKYFIGKLLCSLPYMLRF